MSAPVKFVVTCVVVMGCANLEACRQAERTLLESGFKSRSSVEQGRQCERSFERTFSEGSPQRLLDAACEDLETAIAPQVAAWKAYVQVVGPEGAWATLEAGKPTLRGILQMGSR